AVGRLGPAAPECLEEPGSALDPGLLGPLAWPLATEPSPWWHRGGSAALERVGPAKAPRPVGPARPWTRRAGPSRFSSRRSSGRRPCLDPPAPCRPWPCLACLDPPCPGPPGL